jgi:hypothetical protein
VTDGQQDSDARLEVTDTRTCAERDEEFEWRGGDRLDIMRAERAGVNAQITARRALFVSTISLVVSGIGLIVTIISLLLRKG